MVLIHNWLTLLIFIFHILIAVEIEHKKLFAVIIFQKSPKIFIVTDECVNFLGSEWGQPPTVVSSQKN